MARWSIELPYEVIGGSWVGSVGSFFSPHSTLPDIQLQLDFNYPNTLGPRGVRMTEMFG